MVVGIVPQSRLAEKAVLLHPLFLQFQKISVALTIFEFTCRITLILREEVIENGNEIERSLEHVYEDQESLKKIQNLHFRSPAPPTDVILMKVRKSHIR